MDNRRIADTLSQLADLLEIQGANAFRLRAYRQACDMLRELPFPVADLVLAQRPLSELPGLGKDLAEKVETLVRSGSLPQLDELLEEIPITVLDLLRIPGLGPKKTAMLWRELGITNLDELRAACDQGTVAKLKGFGKKSAETIRHGLEVAAQSGDRLLWAQADEVVQELKTHFDGGPPVRRLEMAGSYRRGQETVGDLDVLAVADDPTAVMDCLATFPRLAEVLLRGDTKMSVRLQDGLQIDLRIVPQSAFGAAWQYFTGSQDHNVELRGRAKKRGLKINEYGVYRVGAEGDEEWIAGADESEVYAAVGLPWIPPELRENREEFVWAEAGHLPELVAREDLRGDLHMHTVATDGSGTIEEMAEAARARGLAYIAITDHSQRVSMAQGLDAKRLRAQWQSIDRLNQENGDTLIVLKGIECDILERGGMDLPDDVLAEADWVIASLHYGQRQPRSQITERLLFAVEHPHVDVIAHPTGRLIGRREPYDVDIHALLEAAARCRKCLELNASPKRLDLHDRHCALARGLGIPIVISSDAHSPAGLDVLRYGVLQARRAGLAASDVLNTRGWSGVRDWLTGREM